jgi:hypothetical protein
VTIRSKRLILSLVAAQVANGLFDAVALYPVAGSTSWGLRAKEWAQEDLDRLRFPERYRSVFPVIKLGAAAGLLVGTRWRGVARLTGAALVAYFVAALGFHVRARDSFPRYVPAFVMLAWSYLVWRDAERL